ncbi:MAG: MBL fold metallo-hydrolase [Rhodothermaceae bacterium]|nr:MAG: MBL fold metallo-hydrolase [Rhodothermaceae bacterium]
MQTIATSMMTVKTFTFNPFMTNCYVCHADGEAVIVDPGTSTPKEREAVVRYLEAKDLTVRHLLLTHAHIDHIFGCAFFARQFGDAFKMHRADAPLLERAQDQAALFGVEIEPPPPAGTYLDEGDTVRFGGHVWQVLHTPGHSPGSICFYDEAGGFVISGDVLFQGSIGRTDLWRGSLPELMASIYQKLMPLPDETRVYPGHGPATTIGFERQNNPFLTGGFSVL